MTRLITFLLRVFRYLDSVQSWPSVHSDGDCSLLDRTEPSGEEARLSFGETRARLQDGSNGALPCASIDIHIVLRIAWFCKNLLQQVYNIILCIITTAYSILTRKVPENYNESRWLNFAMYTFSIAWIIQGISWNYKDESDSDSTDKYAQYDPEVS